jgi:hypothetical protein
MSDESLSGGTVSLPVSPDTKGFSEKLRSGIEGESSGIAAIGAKLGGALMAGLGAVGIALGIGEFVKKGVEEYSAADALNAQFAAGLQSTHNAAGLTVKGMDDLAASISNYSGQAYDSIGKTEQVLQTFTNIRNVGPDKIFDDATTAAANMAAKLGGDASSSAIQLGKALNDPVKGVTALVRVGVTFTQAQKDSIAAMVASGDTMGAQRVILNELNTEFGGAAKAAGETFPGAINRSKVAFGELTKAVVTSILPLLTPVIGGVADLMNKVTPKIDAFSEHVHNAFDYVRGYMSGKGSDAEVGAWEGPLQFIAGLAMKIGDTFHTVFDGLKPVFENVGKMFAYLAPQLAPLIPQLLALWQSFSPVSIIFHALLPVLPQIVTMLGVLGTVISGALGETLKALMPIVTQLVKVLTGDLAGIFKALTPIISQLVLVVTGMLTKVIQELLPVIVMLAGFLGQVFQAIQPLIPVVLHLVEAFLPLLAPLLSIVDSILPLLIPLFGELLKPILALATTLINALMPILSALIQALATILPPVIKALMPIFQSVVSILGDVLTPIIAGVTQVLGGVIDFLTGVFTGNWSKVWKGIGEIFSGIWNGLVGVVKGVVNGIIDLINGVIKGVDSIGGAVGIKIGVIPHLANSGTVLPTPGGTIVRVAEGGKAESVVDTGKLNDLMDRAGGTGDVHVTVVNKTGVALDDLIELHIERNNQKTQVAFSTGVQRGLI